MAIVITENQVDFQIKATLSKGAKGIRIISLGEGKKGYVGRLENGDPPADATEIKIANPLVSRNHLQFRILEKTLCIKDCKSSKGTFLNQVRLSLALEESEWIEVVTGDEIQFGQDKTVDGEMVQAVVMKLELEKFEGKPKKVTLDPNENPPTIVRSKALKAMHSNTSRSDLSPSSLSPTSFLGINFKKSNGLLSSSGSMVSMNELPHKSQNSMHSLKGSQTLDPPMIDKKTHSQVGLFNKL